jgi:hypothetical protein
VEANICLRGDRRGVGVSATQIATHLYVMVFSCDMMECSWCGRCWLHCLCGVRGRLRMSPAQFISRSSLLEKDDQNSLLDRSFGDVSFTVL